MFLHLLFDVVRREIIPLSGLVSIIMTQSKAYNYCKICLETDFVLTGILQFLHYRSCNFSSELILIVIP